jgi:hypothetical protein
MQILVAIMGRDYKNAARRGQEQFLVPTLGVGTRSSPLCGASTTTACQRSGLVRAAERPSVRAHAERGHEENVFRR